VVSATLQMEVMAVAAPPNPHNVVFAYCAAQDVEPISACTYCKVVVSATRTAFITPLPSPVLYFRYTYLGTPPDVFAIHN
jgi:hypothetical protein